MKTLVLIDIQNDYFKGGKSELVGSEDAVQKAKKLVELFRSKNLPIVYIRHISIKRGSPFIINTHGSKIQETVYPNAGEKIIKKHYPNSFRRTELLEHLEGLKAKHLVIVGMMTHMCVDATVRAAKDFGYKIELIADACATKDLEMNGVKIDAASVQASFLAALTPFYSDVKSTEQFLKEQ